MQTNNNKFRPDIQGVKSIKSRLDDNKYIITGIRKDKRPKCCGRKSNIKDYKVVTIRSGSYQGKQVIIKIKKQRYVCPVCRKTQTSELEFIERRCSISKEVKSQIEKDLHDIKSLKQIAKENDVSPSTVIRILDNKELEVDSGKLIKPKGLYIDEFKGNADNEKYQLAMYDEERRLIAILKDRKSKTIADYLNNCIDKSEIEFVVTDMFMQFRNVINKELNVKIVADNFHFIRQVDWMIRDIRIRLYNSDNVTYKDLKKHWKLLNTNATKVSKTALDKLACLLSLNEDLEVGYGFKKQIQELFNKEFNQSTSDRLNQIINGLLESGISECVKLGSTILNWQEQVLNSLELRISNGFVEGKNNKIKVLKRVSFGIKNFNRFRKLIFLRVG